MWHISVTKHARWLSVSVLRCAFGCLCLMGFLLLALNRTSTNKRVSQARKEVQCWM